jgi:hypothetical protein
MQVCMGRPSCRKPTSRALSKRLSAVENQAAAATLVELTQAAFNTTPSQQGQTFSWRHKKNLIR